MTRPIVHYFDYKSPYAFLAQRATKELARETGAAIDFLPYTLHIPSFLGSAEVDEHGQVVSESRNPHQWRRVHYVYMDCRREAAREGLTIRGPRKIFDSSIAHGSPDRFAQRNPTCAIELSKIFRGPRSTIPRRAASRRQSM